MKILFKTLDDIRHQNGVEFWYARELYPMLGYTKWDNFESAIIRAKDSCRVAGMVTEDHFPSVSRKIRVGNGAEKEISDIKLTRYACYLIALNGDPKKEEIAFAQAYFVSQTRSMEVLAKKMEELGRMDVREKLRQTEKHFSSELVGRGIDAKGVARVRSSGDEALFGGKTTEDMKRKLAVPKKQPLADYLPDVTLKAKDLAAAMTVENARRENLRGEEPIKRNHVGNNANVRGALVKSGIYPESLPAGEDIKKVESRHRKETKALQAKHKKELAAAKRSRRR